MRTKDVAQAIYEGALEKKGTDLSAYLHSTVKFLYRKQLLSKSPQILSDLSKIEDKAEGKIEVTLRSTAPIQTAAKKEITELLEKRYKVRHVAYREIIDPELLGGVRIEIGDDVLDLSLRNKINQLKTFLNK